ncbi:hypothetical protein ACQUQP_17485 [Marinobacterium sp. YM272]|uniref:hypothetical protein n=1 Tax=Marinobacterium sp. YM272 TaxID=3421654 RepID=UPI003D7FC56D
MKFTRILVSLVAVSALSLGPLLAGQIMPIDFGQQAHAKGGNSGGNGGGNGGGNAGGQGKGKGQSAAGGLGRSAGPGAKGAQGRGVGNNRGAVASSLGALNAAHASATARAHAAPNSRVGLIAAYERVVEDGISLADDIGDLSKTVAELEAELKELEVDTPAYNQVSAQLAQAKAELDAKTTTGLEEQARVEVSALAEAANKTLSAEVVAEVNALLGIESVVAEEVEAELSESDQY